MAQVDSSSSTVQDFNVEVEGYSLSARHYKPTPTQALGVTYMMAPGADLGHDSNFITGMAGRLAVRGLDVVTFNFPFLQKGSRRLDNSLILEQCCHATMDHIVSKLAIPSQPLVVGGKSMGGRLMSFMAARPGVLRHKISGLIFLGYPLHPPQTPQSLEVVHLFDIKVPMMFVQGTVDPFGRPKQLEDPISAMEVPVKLHRVIGGNHSFQLPAEWKGAQNQLLNETCDAICAWVRKTITNPPA
jgi:uncharacterized protein